jgi:hypothetical protein
MSEIDVQHAMATYRSPNRAASPALTRQRPSEGKKSPNPRRSWDRGMCVEKKPGLSGCGKRIDAEKDPWSVLPHLQNVKNQIPC